MAIFARDGETSVRSILEAAALDRASRPAHHTLPPPRPILARSGKGEHLRRYFKDKLGDIIHVWRALPLPGRNLRSWTGPMLREMRAKNGVGPVEHLEAPGLAERYPAREGAGVFVDTYTEIARRPNLREALAEHGSQRKAAAALGMNLSTFQRRLAKEAA